MLKIALKGLNTAAKKLERWSTEKQKAIRKAMSLALSKEGYRVRKEWARDLKTGNLGLAALALYQNIPGDKGFRRRRKKAPLAQLFGGIVYKVNKQRLDLAVGFLATSAGTAWQAKIAEKSQKPYTWHITPEHREALHSMGIHLKESTTAVRVPARDIGKVAEKRYGDEMLRNIKTLFHRKMAGERI